ncbi:MAG: hypothetical protein V3T86_16630 [Planctomycetota bacterium]
MHPDLGVECKIDFGKQWDEAPHRSGWPYAVEALRSLHVDGGVKLVGFMERRFVWGEDLPAAGAIKSPWIGFLHNPPTAPEWFNQDRATPSDLLAGKAWRKSRRHCRGIFTLSNYLRDWLAPRVDPPVHSLLHPTETPEVRFSMDAYRENTDRALVQIGWWLRNFASLARLPVSTLSKTRLDLDAPFAERSRAEDLRRAGLPRELPDVRALGFLDNDAYDELLSKNLVFLHLYDNSATNTIVECMVRGTPCLVNRLPAVEEYLGPDYPFYFDTLEEAAEKAESMDAVQSAHRYLIEWPLSKQLSAAHFRDAFVRSSIYQSL